MSNRIQTIGYETASVEDFVATLVSAGVSIVLDIRELPISRRKGFAKTALSSFLRSADIEYLHLKGLGDPKEGRIAARKGDYDKFLDVFLAHLETSGAKIDLQRAIDISLNQSACLMCYERDPKACHRSIVANRMRDIFGFQIQHIGVRFGLAKTADRLQSPIVANA